ncbi:MAG: hypothetical protein R2932_45675 [Caldilineaceae bacterium]
MAEQLAMLARLDLEHDNLRAALKWAADNQVLEAGLALAGNLARYWYLRGYWKEGREWLRLFWGNPLPPLRRPWRGRGHLPLQGPAGWLTPTAVKFRFTRRAWPFIDKWATGGEKPMPYVA